MTNFEFAQGLRELADLYERHPELKASPAAVYLYLPYDTDSEHLRAAVKAFADGGVVTNRAPKDSLEFYYRLERIFAGGLKVELNVERSAVCKKVTKMQMVETWECPDSLLDDGKESDEETA